MRTRVISFSSGKGGVGKTTIVSNLGHLWAAQGKKTLLIDGDWSLGKLGIALGAKPKWTVEQVWSGEISLEEAVCPISDTLHLLASPSGLFGLEEISEPNRNHLFFEIDRLRQQYDLILFDHGSGVNWGVLQFAAASHDHVIVTTPEPTSYTDAYAIIKILSRRFSIRNFSLLVTMSVGADTEAIVHRFAELVRNQLDIRLTLLDIIPLEKRLFESIRAQRPFVQTNPDDAITRRFSEVCKKIDHVGTFGQASEHTGLRFFYEPTETTRELW